MVDLPGPNCSLGVVSRYTSNRGILHRRRGGSFDDLALQHCKERDRGTEGQRRCVTSGDIKKHSPLERDVTLLDALHIEAHGWDGAMTSYQRKDPG